MCSVSSPLRTLRDTPLRMACKTLRGVRIPAPEASTIREKRAEWSAASIKLMRPPNECPIRAVRSSCARSR